MELQKRPVRYYETVLNTHVNKEDSAEVVVPDLFPDIERIVDAQGLCCVKDKSVRDGYADVSGVSKISLLYMPEEEQASIRKMDMAIPFEHQFEHGTLTGAGVLSVSASIVSLEARTVNPRKVSVNITLRIEISVYNPMLWELCTDVLMSETADPKAAGSLQLKQDVYTAWLPVSAGTHDFQITDELEIPGSRPPIEEILSVSVRLSARDVHPLGNKAVFKGEAFIKFLYIGQESEGVHSSEHELPFSQIVELEDLDNSSDCRIVLSLSGLELNTRSNEGGHAAGSEIGVTLHVNAVARAWTEKQLEAVSDVYSTYYDIKPELHPMKLNNLAERTTHRQNMREVLETTDSVQSVVDSRVNVCPAADSSDMEAHVTVLYRADDGMLRTASKRMPVPCSYEAPEGSRIESMTAVSGEITAAVMSDGIEIRFTVEFDITATNVKEVMTLSGINGSTDTPADPPHSPSVVLRRLDRGDTLWELAKRHRTTRRELMEANELAAENEAGEGMLILIPRARRER